MNQNHPFNLEVDEYQTLLDKGIAEKLWHNHPKNISVFKTEKNRWVANNEVFKLVSAFTNVDDPADIYEMFEDNKEDIIEVLSWFDTDLLDKMQIIKELVSVEED